MHLYASVSTCHNGAFKKTVDYKNGCRSLKNKQIFKFEVILESLGKMSSNRSSFKYILASLQTNMAKSQISRVDIRVGKEGLDQSRLKNKLGEVFFLNKQSKSIKNI